MKQKMTRNMQRGIYMYNDYLGPSSLAPYSQTDVPQKRTLTQPSTAAPIHNIIGLPSKLA